MGTLADAEVHGKGCYRLVTAPVRARDQPVTRARPDSTPVGVMRLTTAPGERCRALALHSRNAEAQSPTAA